MINRDKDFIELSGVKVTVNDVKKFLESNNIDWNGDAIYLEGYDEYEHRVFKREVLKDDLILNRNLSNIQIYAIENRERNTYRIDVTPLRFTLSRALSKYDPSPLFVMPSNMDKEWIKFLIRNKKDYYEEINSYYNKKIEEIKKDAKNKLEYYKRVIKDDEKKKIEAYSDLKKMIDSRGRKG